MQRDKIRGVVVATLMPFDRSGEIDWDSFKRLLDYCALRPGITAVFVNGHAGEAAALTDGEQDHVIEVTRKHIGDSVTLMGGIVCYNTQDAIDRAKAVEAAGADIAVLFPFPQFSGGAGSIARIATSYVDAVACKTKLPISIFQYPIQSGAGYSTEVLMEIAKHPSVVAIKEGSNDISVYEENVRRIRQEAPDTAVLASNFRWLFAQAAFGADGILSGLTSLLPDALIELWDAAEAMDLGRMRAVNETMQPFIDAIYGHPPSMDMHTRMKVALKELGVIAEAMPRLPLLLPAPADKTRILAAVQSGLQAGGCLAGDLPVKSKVGVR